MKTWRRLPFSLLALWALLLTLVPQMVWACPMTGRVDVASRVCLSVVPKGHTPEGQAMSQGKVPCTKCCNQCCKPLPVPPAPTDEDSHQSHVFASVSTSPIAFHFALSTSEVPLFVAPAPEIFYAPIRRSHLARFGNSPPLFRAQHRITVPPGRAPPVL